MLSSAAVETEDIDSKEDDVAEHFLLFSRSFLGNDMFLMKTTC